MDDFFDANSIAVWGVYDASKDYNRFRIFSGPLLYGSMDNSYISNPTSEFFVEESNANYNPGNWYICKCEYVPAPTEDKIKITMVAAPSAPIDEARIRKWVKSHITSLSRLIKMIDVGNQQIILTGAPGTGKTWIAGQIKKHYGTLKGKDTDIDVQFHPSYDYTDFIEGLRPAEKWDNIVFRKMDGIFKSFCREVEEEKSNPEGDPSEKKYVFVIDEINRADLSKVFGEIMYCLDKRGEKIQTQYSNLKTYGKNGIPITTDVFKEGFFIPDNVVIIGTMNDIDRSVESMDYALRRRFTWYEFEVTKESLEEAFEGMDEWLRDNAEEIAKRTDKLNQVFLKNDHRRLNLNKHYFISQGQFSVSNLRSEQIEEMIDMIKRKIRPDMVPPELDDTFENFKKHPNKELQEFLLASYLYRILPTLEDYVRGADEESIRAFLVDCTKNFFEDI